MILDLWLNEMAKAFASESYVIPTYYTVSTSVTSVLSSDTSFAGERGSRFACTASRTLNTATYTGTRSSTQVVTSAGDALTAAALFSASSSGTVLSEYTMGTITQSTGFDIEFITAVTWGRAN